MKRIISLLIIVMAFAFQVSAQVTIKGTVTDAVSNEPLIGATIIEKGTTNGTVTDIDGNFSFKTENENPTIVVSFIGYLSQEIAYTGQTELNISMKADIAGIDEVVVVGYGTQKKSHLTGSISKVSNEGLDEIPVSRADEALIGKVSGVTIQVTDASAGASPTIRVRGIGSITADASPLVVMDGVVVSSDYLGSIDMNDVESIEVLKDAASAAIYGSRGGNGVIMITTKSGKSGETKFSFDAYRGIKFAANYDNFFPTISEWSQYVKDNNGGALTDKMQYINKMGTETNWIDVMLNGGTIESYSLSARGGSDNTKFAVSGSYLGDEGILLTDDYKKLNMRLKIDSKINKTIKFGGSVNPSYTKKRDFPIRIHDALRNNRWTPIYVDANNFQFVDHATYPDVQIGDYARDRYFDNYDLYGDGSDLVDISSTSNQNPYAKVVERDYETYDFKLFSNAYMQVQLAKGLNFKVTASASYRNRQQERWVGSKAHRNGVSAMESIYNTDVYTHLTNEDLFTYDRDFGKHSISAVAGIAFEKWKTYSGDESGVGYQFDYIRTLNAASTTTASTYINEESLNAFIGRINYAYDNKYLVSVSTRYDGSSRFGADTKYGFFPAFSIGWRLTQEDFLKDNNTISNIKLRMSYGETGNKNGIGYYDAIGRLGATTAIINGLAVTGFNPLNIANPNLGWEKSLETDGGFDFGILDNRFTLSADFYKRTSKDLLLDQDIPAVTGFNVATVNIGEVQNTGFEVELGGRIINKKNFNWNLSLNLSHNKNKLVDFAGASGLISYVDAKRPAEYIAQEGQPISSFYGYVYEKDIPKEYLKNPYYPIGATAQDVYVKDLNGDGEIDTDDRTILGSPYPTYVWGVNSSLTFRDFDFSFTFQGSHGAKVRNLDQQYYENQFSSNMDYVSTFPDADKVVEKIYTNLDVQDASFVALRSVNLGYTLPARLASKVGLSKARVYVAGQNLIYLMADSYTSFNPEGITDNASPLRGGYQVGAYPVPHAVTVGVNLEF